MSDQTSKTTQALPPNRCVAPMEVQRPKVVAGGVGAVASTTKHMLDKMGVARGTRTLLKLNQKEGFDCPSCAWPDPKHRSKFEFCENGAKAVADEATQRRATPAFFKAWSIERLSQQTDYWLNRRGRITRPMYRPEGGSNYVPITWDGAFDIIGKHLRGLDSPDQAAFYTSGRTSNEAAYLYQLFVRCFGTNNLPDCSNMCHESSGKGLGEAIGIGKGTVTLEDFEHADVIVVMGQNPGTNHPRMLTALEHASRRGCKIVSVNPLKEAGLLNFKHPQDPVDMLSSGTSISSHYLQVKVNGDLALLKGLQRALMAFEGQRPGKVLDREFIEQYTAGFEDFAQRLDQVSWDDITHNSGIARQEIEEIARLLAKHDRIIVCWAMGLTQHKNGVGNIQEVVNLLLMRGALGKRGAGVCPVRGHSNVQGDRTMGIWEQPPASFLDQLETYYQLPMPRKHGVDVVKCIDGMHKGNIKVFVAMGGNFLSATPDTNITAEALSQCDLTVQISTKLNRAHLITGKEALILPCLGRTEVDVQRHGPQFVTVENSMGIVHKSEGLLSPASPKLMSEPAIVARLATATLGPEHPVDWLNMAADYDVIRRHIEANIPGCDNYNSRVRMPNGFALPNGVRDSRTFHTHNQKANFISHPIPKHVLADDQYMMMTIRSHDQFNTTIYDEHDRYRGIRHGRYIIFMNVDDIIDADLQPGQLVNITSHFRDEQRTAYDFEVVPYDMPRQCVATYFPEANVLVPLHHTADKSNTPASKSIVVTLEPSITTRRSMH